MYPDEPTQQTVAISSEFFDSWSQRSCRRPPFRLEERTKVPVLTLFSGKLVLCGLGGSRTLERTLCGHQRLIFLRQSFNRQSLNGCKAFYEEMLFFVLCIGCLRDQRLHKNSLVPSFFKFQIPFVDNYQPIIFDRYPFQKSSTFRRVCNAKMLNFLHSSKFPEMEVQKTATIIFFLFFKLGLLELYLLVICAQIYNTSCVNAKSKMQNIENFFQLFFWEFWL